MLSLSQNQIIQTHVLPKSGYLLEPAGIHPWIEV